MIPVGVLGPLLTDCGLRNLLCSASVLHKVSMLSVQEVGVGVIRLILLVRVRRENVSRSLK